jgi:hypothetical protein
LATEHAMPVDAPMADPGGVLPARFETPTLVMTPQVQWRVGGPVLLLAAVAVVVLGPIWTLPLAVVLAATGVSLLPALRDRLEVGATFIRCRTIMHERTIDIGDVDTMRLRRVPFPLLRWLPRGYKVGRFWSIPLTMRLSNGEDPRLDLRCAWWSNWRELARFVLAVHPEVDLDSRTRGRLERYVGVAVPIPSQR